MRVTFEKKYLEQLYTDGKTTDKKHRYQPAIIRKYQFCIEILKAASCKEALFPIKSLRFESLKGDKAGLYSVSVNMQYRIEFTLEEKNTEPALTICNITELSNHYK